MGKIIVNVWVPVLNASYDIFIPLEIPMYEVLELIKKAITELSDGRFVANNDTTICQHEDGSILNINLSVYELDIKNGSKLMLI